MYKMVFRYLCWTTDHAFYYQGRGRPNKVLDDMDLLVLTRLEIYIIEYLQVGMCLSYLEDPLIK